MFTHIYVLLIIVKVLYSFKCIKIIIFKTVSNFYFNVNDFKIKCFYEKNLLQWVFNQTFVEFSDVVWKEIILYSNNQLYLNW